MDQVGLIDPLFTPEDDQAGLVKSPCISAETTFEQPFAIIYLFALSVLRYVENDKPSITSNLYKPKDYQMPIAGVKIFIDQYFLGMCTQIDAFYYYMRQDVDVGDISVESKHFPSESL